MKLQSYLILLIAFCLANSNQIFAKENPQELERVLEQIVIEQRESSGLVGLGTVIFHNGEFVGPSVSGERKRGSQVPLSENDKWHVGSITKSITATMIARLVEKGELSWDSSVTELFIDIEGLDAQWDDVTLADLLTHTSGAIPNFPFSVRLKKPAAGLERKVARETAVISVLKNKPKSTPGSTFTYSNVGYTIAGVIAEKKTGMVWEELIKKEIFGPLELQSGGFGHPQDRIKKLEQPRGHRKILGFTVASETQDDNTPIMGPASTIHLSLKDLALFANDHLQGEKGQGTLLKTETYRHLHKPHLKRNAYGWIVSARKHLGVGSVIWHSGSNTWWYAMVAFIPDINAVVAVTSNDGNIELAKQSAWDIVNQVVPLLALSHNKNDK